MNGGDSTPKPDTTPASDAQKRLSDAGFKRFAVARPPAHLVELWQNKHRKTVQIQYCDENLQGYWTESVENALQLRDARPRDPFAGLFS
jgi:hypothetical protein